MRTIVLDTGAFVAAERNDRKLAAIVRAAADDGATILLPATVVAETYRNPPKHGTARLLKIPDQVVPLDAVRARAVGALLGTVGSAQMVDASVALIAIAAMPSLVLTSDPDDICRLLSVAGIPVRRRAGAKNAVAVERV